MRFLSCSANNFFPFISDWGFKTESEMTSTLLANSHEAMDYVLAGVAFTNMPEDGTSMPTKGIAYKLRFPSLWRQAVAGFSDWKTNLEYPIDMDQGPRESRDDTGGDPRKLCIVQICTVQILTWSVSVYKF